MAVHRGLTMAIKEPEGNRMLSFFGLLIVSAFALLVLAVPLVPASAQGFVGLQLGPFGLGIGTPYYPYYYPYYYYPPPVYYYPY
jgi:hypothetical protein